MNITIVVAANWRDYKDWCAANGRHPYGRGMVYASSSSRLRGYSGPVELAITSSGWDRPDLGEIGRELAVIEAAERWTSA